MLVFRGVWSVECEVRSDLLAPIGLGVAVANSSLFTLHFQHSSLFILQRYKIISTCARVLRICFRFIWSVKIGSKLCIMHYELCIENELCIEKRLRYSLGAFSIFTPSVCAIRLEDKYFQTYQMILWYFGTFDIVHGRLNNRHFRVIVIQ